MLSAVQNLSLFNPNMSAFYSKSFFIAPLITDNNTDECDKQVQQQTDIVDMTMNRKNWYLVISTMSVCC